MEVNISEMGKLASDGKVEPLLSTFISFLKKIESGSTKVDMATPMK